MARVERSEAMALRKYGTDVTQRVTGVESTEEAERIKTTASARPWTEEDERDLQDEVED